METVNKFHRFRSNVQRVENRIHKLSRWLNNRHSLQSETRSTRERCDDLSKPSNQLFQMGTTIRLKASNLLRSDNHLSKLRQTINLLGRKKLVQTAKRIQSKSLFVKASVVSSLLNKVEMQNSSVIFKCALLTTICSSFNVVKAARRQSAKIHMETNNQLEKE